MYILYTCCTSQPNRYKVVWIPLFLVCIPLLIISGLMFDYTPRAIPVNMEHWSYQKNGRAYTRIQ